MFSAKTFIRLLSLCLIPVLMLGGCVGGTTESPPDEPTEATLPKNIMQKSDPEEDNTLNILLIGNSSCVYWPDELYGMLTAAGYTDVNVCDVYYSGCSLQKHWTWWKNGERNYRFDIHNKDGKKQVPDYGLNDCLQSYNWDVISLQGNMGLFGKNDITGALANVEPYLDELVPYIRDQFPLSRMMWHQTWATEIGYNLAFEMKTVEQRTQMHQVQQGVAAAVSEKYDLTIVPTGDALEKIRDLPLFTSPIEGIPAAKVTPFLRVQSNKLVDDGVHDGDMGGGQYLNACVWFEVITGRSCVGNTFRPQYTYAGLDCSLSEEKISVLQNAAHEAVENRKASN